MKKLVYIGFFALLASCASKQMRSSIESLEKQNQVLRSDIDKLQVKIHELDTELLVVQNKVENPLKMVMVQQPVPVPMVAVDSQLPGSKAPVSREPSFFDDQNIQFTDEEPSLKFTNKDLRDAPVTVPPKTATTKPKSDFTEQTLVADNSKITPQVQSGDDGVQDPAIVSAYNKAYKTFKEQNYQDTIRLMSEFLKQFPNHPYSDNAAFWIGESYYQLREYQRANKDFEKVIQNYPNGNKVPDALLRSGICELKLSQPEKAKSSFDTLIKKYPESLAAKRAMATLGEL